MVKEICEDAITELKKKLPHKTVMTIEKGYFNDIMIKVKDCDTKVWAKQNRENMDYIMEFCRKSKAHLRVLRGVALEYPIHLLLDFQKRYRDGG
jgi:hypothetical protein